MSDSAPLSQACVQLGIFAKPPQPHRVKTRLIPDIGADNATAVYRYCLQHALQVATDSQLDLCCYLTEESNDPVFAAMEQRLQSGDSLGDRMLNAFQEMLADHDAAIIIGTDCLDMTVPHLQQAAQLLLDHDMVLQPVIDGGYSLIACRYHEPALFEGVRWSTSEVLSKTMQNARSLGYRVAKLETVRDIDTLQDLKQYAQFEHLLAQRVAVD